MSHGHGKHTIKCRHARPEDASEIARFQLAMALETENLELDPPTVALGVRAVFDDPSKGNYFVAERDGRVIASLLVIEEWSDWRNGKVWWIHSVYVLPNDRGVGAFAALYAHLRKRVTEEPSLRGLRLYVDKNNSAAQTVYEKIGMTRDHYHLYEWMKTF
jgi:GNAT superfamily N-acetyltransferase